jgi:cyclophilin family peptidyl-prolyl cis-trans isomerase
MKEKSNKKAPIKNESSNGLKNEKYTLAMARTNVPDSATSQFYINTANNGFLNKSEARDGYGYAVFGRVVEGQDVVDKISAVPTGQRGPHGDVPLEAVVIESITEVE